ncbi:MAG: AAA family ATPase [Candidatus Levyibacteriota bacterium]
MNSKITGVTGAFGSGKSTAAEFFEERGFHKIILSAFLEEEARKRGITEITRAILQDIGNEWREKNEKSILADKALDEIEKRKLGKVAIDGIRNVGEIGFLRNSGNFTLIAIISDKKIRFERLRKLKRRENLTWELFKKLDSRDAGVSEKETGLHVDECIEMADYRIENNGSEEVFKNKLEDLLNKL